MNQLLKLEDLLLFLLSIFLFSQLSYPWWLYPLLLLTPDLSMVGYLANARVGAYSYNLAHHRGLAITLFLIGIWLAAPAAQLAGIIMFGHSSLDRVFGYGLKHTDAFQHTHLGWIGEAKVNRETP